MSNSRVISLAAVVALGIACVSADALAARVAARGGAVAYRGGAVAYRGAVGYRGWGDRADYYRPGIGLAAGAIAGGAIAASRPWYGYGGYDYGSGYYGYNPGYSASNYSSIDYGSSYYGYNPGYSTSDSTGTDYDLGYYGWYPGYSTSYSTSGGQDAAYCAQRFRSYDPGSGTYLGYDGQRHPCP